MNGVEFSTQYVNPQNIIWDFGDFSGSNLASPSHTFIGPGSYTVTFNATVGGVAVEDSIVIQVFDSPIADFTVVGLCLETPFQFTDISEGTNGSVIVNWEWTFGDGGSLNGVQNPTYSYPEPGLYDIGLIVTDENGCTDAIILQDLPVSGAPDLFIIVNPNPPTACDPPLTVEFSANANSNSPTGPDLTYSWEFGNGNDSEAANPPDQTYTDFGNYTYSLEVTDDQGCTASGQGAVNIDSPVADFTIVGVEDGVVCAAITIENLTSFNPVFDYGDGQSGSDLFYLYDAAGEYTVTMTVGQAGCSDTASLTFEVEIPEFEIVSDPTFLCSVPGEINLSVIGNAEVDSAAWFGPDQFTENIIDNDETAIVTVFYEDTVTYQINGFLPLNYNVTVYTANGCVANAQIQDTLWQPNALIFADVISGCAPLVVAFSDSSTFFEDQPGVQWEWFIDDEVIVNSDPSSVSYTFTEPGEYEPFLVVTNSAGCTDTSYAPIIYVGGLLPIDFDMNPNPVCIGEEVSFEALGDLSDFEYFNFDADDSRWEGCFLEDQQTFLFQNEPGVQDVTITAVYNGCASTFTQEFTINGAVGRSRFDCNCDTPLDYDFTAEIQNGSSWDWDFGDATQILNDNTNFQSHSYAESGDYNLVLTTYSDDGCPPFVDTLAVFVRQIEAILDPIDTLLCAGVMFDLNAGLSIDNQEFCYTGYTVFWGDDTPPNFNATGAFDHEYATTGEKIIRLAVIDVNGCRDTTNYTVDVFGISTELASDVITGCIPLDVLFDGSALADTTIVNLVWDFDDGTTQAGLDFDVAHTFNFPLNIDPFTQNVIPWQVTFTAFDTLGCTSSSMVNIIPIVPEVELGNVSDPTACVGDVISFTPSPNLPTWNYTWTIDGEVYNEATPIIQFNEAGTFDVLISIVDENGCLDDSFDTAVLDVQAYPIPIISSTADELEVLCYPLQASFTNVSDYNDEPEGTISWDLGNGSPVQPLNTVSTTFDAPGIYVADMEVSTSNGCSASITDTLVVVGPVASISVFPEEICKGESVLLTMSDTADVWVWEWDLGDGTIASGENPVEHSYFFNPAGGTVNPVLTVWSLDSVCSFSYTTPVDIYEVIADFDRNGETLITDSIHCDDTFDTFTNTSLNADIFEWDFGNGVTSTAENPPIQDFPPGTYSITLYAESSTLGCRDTIVKTMVIHPLPVALAEGGFICQGDEIQLFAEGGTSYSWTPPADLNSSVIADPLASPSFTTAYTVTVTDDNDCSSTAIANVNVFLPLPPFEVDTTIIIGEEVTIFLPPGIDGYTYEWSPDQWIDCIDCPVATSQPEEDIIYYILVSDTLGCFTIEYIVDIEVLPLSSVDVPLAFTPNGDGVNDIIYVRGWGIKELLTFQIYNRWGEQVYISEDIEEGWDGFYKGEIQNMDTYTYIVRVATYIDDAPLEKNGYIMLKR